MKKHNPYIIITTTIIVLAILFVSFKPLSIVNYDYGDLAREGNSFILTIDQERVDDTTGFLVSMNDAYLKIFRDLASSGMILKTVCVVNANVINTHNLMTPFTLVFNGVSSTSEGNLVCTINDKTALYSKIRSNCDLTKVSSPDSCIGNSIFTESTQITWTFADKDDLINVYRLVNNACQKFEINQVDKKYTDFNTLEECKNSILNPTTDWKLYLIIGLIIGSLIFVYIKSKGGKTWLKILKNK